MNQNEDNSCPFLGIPKDETEWLKYRGECIVFAGNLYDEEEGEYIMESEEDTKERLICGLLSVGIKCDKKNVQFQWTDKTTGERSCCCTCYYNKPYQVYYSEFFIKDFPVLNSTLEFTFTKRLFDDDI